MADIDNISNEELARIAGVKLAPPPIPTSMPPAGPDLGGPSNEELAKIAGVQLRAAPAAQPVPAQPQPITPTMTRGEMRGPFTTVAQTQAQPKVDERVETLPQFVAAPPVQPKTQDHSVADEIMRQHGMTPPGTPPHAPAERQEFISAEGEHPPQLKSDIDPRTGLRKGFVPIGQGTMPQFFAGLKEGGVRTLADVASLVDTKSLAAVHGFSPEQIQGFDIDRKTLHKEIEKGLLPEGYAELPTNLQSKVARGAGMATVPLVELYALAALTGGAATPFLMRLAINSPKLAAELAPIISNVVPFTIQGALQPEEPGKGALYGAGMGAALSVLPAGTGRALRFLFGAGVGGAGHILESDFKATGEDVASSSILMGAFLAAHGKRPTQEGLADIAKSMEEAAHDVDYQKENPPVAVHPAETSTKEEMTEIRAQEPIISDLLKMRRGKEADAEPPQPPVTPPTPEVKGEAKVSPEVPVEAPTPAPDVIKPPGRETTPTPPIAPESKVQQAAAGEVGAEAKPRQVGYVGLATVGKKISPVFRNPSSKEIREIAKSNQFDAVRLYIDTKTGDVITWNTEILHSGIQGELINLGLAPKDLFDRLDKPLAGMDTKLVGSKLESTGVSEYTPENLRNLLNNSEALRNVERYIPNFKEVAIKAIQKAGEDYQLVPEAKAPVEGASTGKAPWRLWQELSYSDFKSQWSRTYPEADFKSEAEARQIWRNTLEAAIKKGKGVPPEVMAEATPGFRKKWGAVNERNLKEYGLESQLDKEPTPTPKAGEGKIAPETPLTPEDHSTILSTGLNVEQFKMLGRSLDDLTGRLFHYLNDKKSIPNFLQGAAERHIEPELLRSGMKDWLRWGYLPEYVARKWPAFAEWKEGSDKAYDVQAHHRQEVWQRMMAYTRGLNAEERSRVDDVRRKLDRVTDPNSRRYLENKIAGGGWTELQRYKSKGKPLTEKEAQSLYGVWDAYRYVKIETINDMVQDTATLGAKFGLEPDKASEFAAKVLKSEGDLAPIIGEYLPGKETMLSNVLTKQRENYQFWSKERNLYVLPHTRWGPYWTHVFDKEGKTLWAGSSEKSRGARVTRNQLEYELTGNSKETPLLNELSMKEREYLLDQHRQGNLDIRDSVREKIPMSLYGDVNMPGMSAIISKMRDRLTGDAWQLFLEAKQVFFAEKGWGRHKIGRKGIPGFESENLRRVDADYMEGWAGMKGKSARVKAFNEAWANTDVKDEALLKYTQNYTHYLLDHPKEATWVRRGLYHMYLGGSMGFRVLHALHAFQTGWPVLSTVGNGSLKTLTRAISDRAQMTLFEHGIGKDPLKPAERAALEVARHSSSLQQDFSNELAAKGNSPFYRFTSNDPTSTMAKAASVARMIYYPTDMDRGLRESIFLASLRLQGKIDPDTIQSALKHVDESMFRYTRGERPQFARGGIGSAWMAFQTWTMKYFHLIGKLAKEGEVGALGRLALAASLVGGTDAVAVGLLAKKGYEMGTGRDAEKDSKEYLQSIFGDKAGEIGSRTFWRGVPAGLLGFDLSPRMVHHIPLLGTDYAANPWNILGAVTGPFKQGQLAKKAINEEDYWRALEFAAPTWARNALAAKRLSKESPTTLSGRPMYGEDLKPVAPLSTGESIRKAMGLQPTRLSETQSRREYIGRQEKRIEGKTDKYAVKYTNALRKNDEKGKQDVIDDLMSYNNRMLKKERYADIIDPESFIARVLKREEPKYPEKSLKRSALRKMQEAGPAPIQAEEEDEEE